MPGDLFDNSSQLQNATLVTTAETLVLANAVQQVAYSSGIVFNGVIYMTPGTGTTSVTIRVRRGYGTSGATDYEVQNIAVTAGVLNAVPLAGVMGAAEYQQNGGGQHSITVQQVGATGNGSFTYASVAFINSEVAAMGLTGSP
jgi:hypothetical protein